MTDIIIKLLIISCVLGTVSCYESAEQKESRLRPRLPLDEQITRAKKIKLIGIFVDSKSTKRNPDGKSWHTAFSNINDAVKVANGANIYVAAGSYEDPYIDLSDKKNVNIIGGYKAGAQFEEDKKGKVILEGVDRPLLVINGSAENIFISGISFEGVRGESAVKIEGKAKTPTSAAIPINNVRFYNCTFANNTNKPTALGKGAGLYVANATRLNISNSKFEQNQATEGGGIFFENVENSKMFDVAFVGNSSTANGLAFHIDHSNALDLYRLVFTDNENTSALGAVYIADSSDIALNFQEKLSAGNEAANGAVIYALSVERLNIRDGRFNANTAQTWGGAIFLSNCSESSIVRSVFAGNKAHRGGALYVAVTELNVERSIFERNQATQNGGAILTQDIRAPIIFKESTFIENEASSFGGALALDAKDGPPIEAKYTIDIGTKFIRNRAGLDAGGGAIFLAVISVIPVEKELVLKNNAADFENNISLGLRGKAIRIAPHYIDDINEASLIDVAAGGPGAMLALPGDAYDYIDTGSTGLGIADANEIFKY